MGRKRKLVIHWSSGDTPFVETRDSGILQLCFLTGEVPVHTIGNDKHLYVKIEDVLKWHENEIQYARTPKLRKLQEQVIERCKEILSRTPPTEDSK